LDHHTHVMVWSGTEVSGPQFDLFRDACIQKTAYSTQLRLPAPQILNFKEGSSSARWLQARLIPSHKDSLKQQQQSFPQIGFLSDEQRIKLMDKFPPTDQPSFHQFYHQLFNK